MKLELIKEFQECFILYLQKKSRLDDPKNFEIQQKWQRHFDLTVTDLSSGYDHSLDSQFSNALWGGSSHSVKAVMLRLLEVQPALMKAAFEDLLDESKPLVLRLERFEHHADMVFQQFLKAERKWISHEHHHRKYPLMYLAFHYPMYYCMWDYVPYVTCMEKIGNRNIPTEFEYERYYKTLRAVFKILMEDGRIGTEYNRLLTADHLLPVASLMVMNDFITFVSRS